MNNENWTAENIGDQKGRVVIVTGSTSGIGEETARIAAEKGAEVVMAVRNTAKGESVAAEIVAGAPDARVVVRELDLASLSSVRTFAEAFGGEFDRLDVLVNNAGVMMPPYSKTEDGFELQMGTNHFGHFALTGLLLPLLEKTEGSRVVNVSSLAHRFGDIDFGDLAWEDRSYSAQRAYGDSKIANLYFTYELAKRTGGKPMVLAAHPGYTATDLQRHSSLYSFTNRFLAQDSEMGALPTLRAAFDEDAENGEFYGPAKWGHWRGYPVAHESNSRSRDPEVAERLWTESERLTGVTA